MGQRDVVSMFLAELVIPFSLSSGRFNIDMCKGSLPTVPTKYRTCSDTRYRHTLTDSRCRHSYIVLSCQKGIPRSQCTVHRASPTEMRAKKPPCDEEALQISTAQAVFVGSTSRSRKTPSIRTYTRLLQITSNKTQDTNDHYQQVKLLHYEKV